jgi:hypothetical protein
MLLGYYQNVDTGDVRNWPMKPLQTTQVLTATPNSIGSLLD